MSDPLSLAAAGAGFVSLGLTICDAIYKYTNASAGKSADMRQLREAADDLKSVVPMIEARLIQPTLSTNAASMATRTAIEDKIRSCNATADRILELVEKHGPAQAAANRGERIKRLARAGLYPMRREGIMELQQACQRYNLGLVLLLQLLEVDGIAELRDALVAKIDAVDISTSSHMTCLEQRVLAATSAGATRIVQETREIVSQNREDLARTIDAASSRTEASIMATGKDSVKTLTEAGIQQSSRTQDLILQRIEAAEASILSSGQHIVDAVEAQPEAVGARINQELQASLASHRQDIDLLLRGNFETFVAALSAHRIMMESTPRHRLTETPATVSAHGPGIRTEDRHLINNLRQGTSFTPISDSPNRHSASGVDFSGSHSEITLAASSCHRPPPYESQLKFANGLKPGSARAVDKGCTCPAPAQVRVSKPQRYFGSLWLKSEESVVHHRKCPLWFLSRRRRTFHINYSAFGFAVYGPVEVENSPFFWLKNLHIDPKLSFRSVVQGDSPSFRLVTEFCLDCTRPPMSQETSCLQTLERSLLKLFEEGKASPRDVDTSGNNLLHHLYAFSVWVFLQRGTPRKSLKVLTSALCDMGVPRNDANNLGRAPVSALFERTAPPKSIVDGSLALLPFLYESGALDDVEDWCRGVVGLYAQKLYEWCLQSTTSGRPLSKASAQGDVAKVRSLLDASPERLVTERNVLGQTPVHLAVLQPAVLPVLLERSTCVSIIDHEDRFGNSALCYALMAESSQAFLMLADSGASLGPALSLLDNRWRMCPNEMCSAVAKACRARLDDLIHLGIAHGCASDQQLNQFPHPRGLFKKVALELERRGIGIPVGIKSVLDFKPFEHLVGLRDSAFAGALWDHGLLRVDEWYRGAPPILRNPLRLQAWWYSKGAPLDISMGFDGLDVAHILSSSFDTGICRARNWVEFNGDGTSGRSDQIVEFMDSCLRRPPPNTFQCHCIGTTSTFIPFRRREQHFFDTDPHAQGQLWLFLNQCYLAHSLEERPSDFLRAFTFSGLQLTHTCPLLNNPYLCADGDPTKHKMLAMEATEIERIHQAEEVLIIRFERLLDELVEEYHERNLPFLEFLAAVWFPRMTEEVDQFDDRSENFLENFRRFLVFCGEFSSNESNGEILCYC